MENTAKASRPLGPFMKRTSAPHPRDISPSAPCPRGYTRALASQPTKCTYQARHAQYRRCHPPTTASRWVCSVCTSSPSGDFEAISVLAARLAAQPARLTLRASLPGGTPNREGVHAQGHHVAHRRDIQLEVTGLWRQARMRPALNGPAV